jgi:hypothetical protein
VVMDLAQILSIIICGSVDCLYFLSKALATGQGTLSPVAKFANLTRG